MIRYILFRIAFMVPTLIIISVLVFTIIELPPGDYFESYIAELKAQGEGVNLEQIAALRQQYGFDQPLVLRYFYWVFDMLRGDFGYSFEYQLPVSDIVGDRLWLTVLVSFVTIIFTWIIAFPIGIYSATHQYSWGDYGLTFLGLLGIAIPNFMLALILDVFCEYLVWHQYRPSYGPAISVRTDELRQVQVDPLSPLDTGDHRRNRRYRGHDPAVACQSA